MAIPSLADEIRAYIETGALPPPRPGDEATLDYALRRWAKRAAALAQVRDELLEENARLRQRLEKLEAVAEAAREVLQIAVDKLRNRDGLLQLESWVLVPKELVCKLASALDALGEERSL